MTPILEMILQRRGGFVAAFGIALSILQVWDSGTVSVAILLPIVRFASPRPLPSLLSLVVVQAVILYLLLRSLGQWARPHDLGELSLGTVKT